MSTAEDGNDARKEYFSSLWSEFTHGYASKLWMMTIGVLIIWFLLRFANIIDPDLGGSVIGYTDAMFLATVVIASAGIAVTLYDRMNGGIGSDQRAVLLIAVVFLAITAVFYVAYFGGYSSGRMMRVFRYGMIAILWSAALLYLHHKSKIAS